MGFDADTALLKRLELNAEILDSGCCGMAGSFGFQSGDHYDVSLKVGNMVLLPAVQRASTDTLVLADGFSCREQIAQTTNRQGLHLAQVIQMALHHGEDGIRGAFPERRCMKQAEFHGRLSSGDWTLLVAVGAVLAGGLALKKLAERRRSRRE